MDWVKLRGVQEKVKGKIREISGIGQTETALLIWSHP